MIFVGIISRPIGSETLIFLIIVMIHLFPRPVMTFDAKMVISLHCQGAVPIPGFKAALGQGNACWYTHTGHLLHGKIRIGLNIRLPGHLLPPLPKQRETCCEQQNQVNIFFL